MSGMFWLCCHFFFYIFFVLLCFFFLFCFFACFFFFFFFFQAEDGIRDGHVTGVQTCALPISVLRRDDVDLRTVGRLRLRHLRGRNPGGEERDECDQDHLCSAHDWRDPPKILRSEERRVGKECRYRWSRYHKIQKENVTSTREE